MAETADRHLLIGLLALQNGIIDQGQLLAAFQAWTLEKSRGLADHLQARGDLSAARRALLEALVDVHLEAHGGDVRRSLSAVSAGKSTREALAGIGDPDVESTLGFIGSSPAEAGGPVGFTVGTSSSDGQRFRVLRPHARGGLGAVFVALDGELNREVALKQILDHHADDPTSRARFLIEAEITGGLEHPGIVPVYGLGTYDGGRPYYAMRFVRGDSLKEAIERFHRPGPADANPGARSLGLRMLLRRFTDVCNAIEYAHSRGVLHRDIKPGNVIVGKHGETLVIDWGLAKALGRSGVSPEGERTLVTSSASGSAETLPGSAMGTPAYMSPEQAAGDLDRLGSRSDVYGLGATLYCILTGKPPFDGEVGEVLRRVRIGEFSPPRQVDPGLDPALEAICLKAMATSLDDRYESCKALAEDVERWAADEPVAAWPEPWSRRARRWSRRNRTAVTAAAVALVAGVVGLAAVLAVQTRAKDAIARSLEGETRANEALAAANADLIRSRSAVQARYELAFEAIKAFHTGVSEDFLLKQDQFKELRDRLLKSASEFYGKLGALLGDETDPTSRRALAASNFELAELTGRVGRFEDALAVHRSVLASREALAAGPGAGTSARVDVGRSLGAVAGLLAATGRPDEALATLGRSEALLAGPAGADPGARAALAACRLRLGGLLSSTGRKAEALAAYIQARVDQEAPAAGPGAKADARRDLSDTLNAIGLLLAATGKPAEAEASYRRAIGICRRLADENPDVAEFPYRLATAQMNLANLLSTTGKSAEAEEEFRRAMATCRGLSDEYPAVAEFRSRLATVHINLGRLLTAMGKPTEAEATLRQALAICRGLADDNPAVAEYRSHMGVVTINLGNVLLGTGKSAEAEAVYRQSIAIHQGLADANPAVTEYRNRLTMAQSNLSQILQAAGKLAEAEATLRQALATNRRLVDDNPAVTEYRNLQGVIHANLGRLLGATGKSAEAAQVYRSAIAAYRRLADENPSVTDHRSRMAIAFTNLGGVLMAGGRREEAAEVYRQAAAICRRLVDDNPAVADFRSQLGVVTINLGNVLLGTGRSVEVEELYRQAIATYRRLAEENPAVADFRIQLATFERNLGDVLREMGRPSEAEAAWRRALEVDRRLAEDRPIAEFRSRLADSYLGLGSRLLKLGRTAEAEAEERRALALYEAVAGENPGVPNYRHDIAACNDYLADLLRPLGRAAEARDGSARAIALRQQLSVEDSTNMGFRRGLAWSLLRRGLSLRDLDDPAGAAGDARRALAIYDGLPEHTGKDWFRAACCHSALAGLAGREGAGVSPDSGLVEAEAAMAMLQTAVRTGYPDLNAFRTESALDPLRGRPDFRLIMMDLVIPADPFSHR